MARGVVEKDDGAYRVADREAVLAAIGAEGESEDIRSVEADELRIKTDFVERFRESTVEPRLIASLLGALMLVVLTRLVMWHCSDKDEE